MLKLVIAGESDGTWPVPVSALLVQEWRDREGQVRAFGYADGPRGWLEWPGLATFAFEEGSDEVFATPSAGSTTQAVEELFRRNALPIILQARGWEALHARAVLSPRGIVGLCGASEAGVFALAYGLDRLGYRRCAEVALLLNLRGAVRVEMSPLSPRAASASLDMNPGERLCSLFVVAQPSASSTDSETLSRPEASPRGPTLLKSRPSPRMSSLLWSSPFPRLTRLAGIEAFSAIVAHAYCFNPADPQAKRRLAANYMSLVSQVPVYLLELEGGLQQVEAAMQLILDIANTPALVSAAH